MTIRGTAMTPIFQMRKWRFSDGSELAQGIANEKHNRVDPKDSWLQCSAVIQKMGLMKRQGRKQGRCSMGLL